MFSAWGRFVHRHHWIVLAVSVLLLAASGFIVAEGAKLQPAGPTQTAESARATKLIEQELPRASAATFVLIYSSSTQSTTDPAFQAEVARSLEPLRSDPRVASVVSPFDGSAGDPAPFISKDGHAAFVQVALKDDLVTAGAYYPELRSRVTSNTLQVQATGTVAIVNGFNTVLATDLRRAEVISLPLVAILLLIVFGSVVAAFIPLGVGVLAVIGGLAGMFLLARATDVSQYAENIVTLLGLGVAIDYSLFVTDRFREELHRGRTEEEAIANALSTAGRAITFSGLTVAIGESGMLFYQGTYLTSMGVAAAIVVAMAVLYGLTFLPALLSVLGRRVDLIRVPLFAADPTGRGPWHSLAMGVMKRPILVLVPIVGVIAAIASPIIRLDLANGDVTMLPKREESRAAYDMLVSRFPGAGQTHVQVVVRYDSGAPLGAERIAQLVDLEKKLEALPNARKVQSPFSLDPRLDATAYTALYTLPASQLPPPLQAVVTAMGPQRLAALRDQTVGPHIVLYDVSTDLRENSEAAHRLVRDARALAAPPGAEKLVTGFPASDLDTVTFIEGRTVPAVAYVMLATAIVLFLLLGSVVLPVKAIVMNLLSIGASFGALVFVFQEGRLADQLGFTASGTIDPTLPVIMFCSLFGLSMDYEVLLLSRIQEEYARSHDNTGAVAEGLERSGRLITGAAAIMVGVFLAFGLAEVFLIKALGLGMALAVAIDATLVRALVVPATMRLLGRANWWAPGPLARLYRRLALSERHGEGLVTAADTGK
ncbi:MAG: MMPL family transporter [Chloroflexota bacterium]|nr:MMPL family transporter [Chloroflexota bacterium]